MVATVFISHSCKDNEDQPPPGLSPAEAAARAERLAFARKLRDALKKELEKDPHLKIFLDVRGGLTAGDVWRDGLHKALRTCSAGIVLLTPESLESGWVRKEATILSWRVFLREPVVLIPIVLGISHDELDKEGFGALDLDAIQWVRVARADEAGLAVAVKETVDALDGRLRDPLAHAELLSPRELWIRQLADSLGESIDTGDAVLKSHYLVSMCNELRIATEDRERFDENPLVHIASHLLLADDSQIVRFLRHVGKPNEIQRESLRSALASLWVDATPASRVLSGESQVVAIDANQIATAREYLVRALCNQSTGGRVAEPSDVTGGSDAEVIEEIRNSMADLIDLEPDALAQDIAENGPFYVILGPGSARPSVLDKITKDYEKVTFIVAAGAQPREKLGDWNDRALLLKPLLQPLTREAAAFRFRNKLERFVRGTP